MLFVLPVAGVHRKQRPSNGVLHLTAGEQRNKNPRGVEVMMKARSFGHQGKGKTAGYGKQALYR